VRNGLPRGWLCQQRPRRWREGDRLRPLTEFGLVHLD
jgi:hypothetical protein